MQMCQRSNRTLTECAIQALEEYNIGENIAAHTRNFGRHMTPETKHFNYVGQVALLLFQSG